MNVIASVHRTPRFLRRQLAPGLLALVLVTLFVSRMSGAAFSGQTDNSGNSFSAAGISLTDSDSGAALFNATSLAPGQSATGCITVTKGLGQVDPLAVKVYSGGMTDSADNLASHLTLKIEQGGPVDTCLAFLTPTEIWNDTLAAFHSGHASYANGVGTWDPPAALELRSYRFTVTLAANAPGAVQDDTVTNVVFMWETQTP